MSSLWRIVLALVWLTGVSAAGAQAAPPSADAAILDPPRQLLVLLAIPAAHFLPEANYSSGYGDAAGRAARHRVAAALAAGHGLTLGIDWPMPSVGLHCYVMDVPAERDPADIAVQLAHDPRVSWAQAMHLFRPLGHDDPLFDMQPAAREWHLEELHAVASGLGVRVAVIDSAVQADHPDLAGQVATNADFTGEKASAGERHGTAVAGIVAALADNRAGIAGVAPRARLHALRACVEARSGDATTCATLPLALALNAAIEQSDQIINLSLGGPQDRLIRRLVEAALARGIDVVAAVDTSAPDGGFPADVPGVFAVVGVERSGMPPGTIVAPGRDVPTTVPVSRWAALSGASYAAAHVSGLLALIRGEQARNGRARGASGMPLVLFPDGRVDACASLVRAGAPCACDCGQAPPLASVSRR